MKFMDTSCEEKIGIILRRIQNVYLVLLIFSGLLILPLLASLIGEPPIPEKELQDLFQFGLNLSIYLGLYKKRKWVVPFILIVSAFSSLLFLLQFLTPATDTKLLLAKGTSGLMCIFFVYQAIFFSKKEVQNFFGMNNKMILGG